MPMYNRSERRREKGGGVSAQSLHQNRASNTVFSLNYTELKDQEISRASTMKVSSEMISIRLGVPNDHFAYPQI